MNSTAERCGAEPLPGPRLTLHVRCRHGTQGLQLQIAGAGFWRTQPVDTAIAAHLSDKWTIERLDPVLRALLRAAAAELWAGGDTPARVVINEYMDIAHGFFDGEEPRFANGVLDALARQMRGGEFQPRG